MGSMINKEIISLGLLILYPFQVGWIFKSEGSPVYHITIAIIANSDLVGTATEEIAVVTGPSIGGLLKCSQWSLLSWLLPWCPQSS